MTKRLAAPAFAAGFLVLLTGCPPTSIVGVWSYFDCDGTPLATVQFSADGTMSYETKDHAGTGTGTWTEVDGKVDFMADVMFNVQGILIFSGDLLSPDRIEGEGTSDQAPGGPCVVMLR